MKLGEQFCLLVRTFKHVREDLFEIPRQNFWCCLPNTHWSDCILASLSLIEAVKGVLRSWRRACSFVTTAVQVKSASSIDYYILPSFLPSFLFWDIRAWKQGAANWPFFRCCRGRRPPFFLRPPFFRLAAFQTAFRSAH